MEHCPQLAIGYLGAVGTESLAGFGLPSGAEWIMSAALVSISARRLLSSRRASSPRLITIVSIYSVLI
jgi:hypothetical protein